MVTGTSRMFGTELRRQRLEAGLSLTDLAKLVHYSKSHLSKVETGAKPPSTDLVRQCEAALSSDGTLIELAPSSAAHVSVKPQNEAGEVWILMLDTAREGTFTDIGRRALLAGGAAAVAAWASSHPVDHVPAGGTPIQSAEPTLASFRAIFDNLRPLGQWVSPGLMIPQLAAQAHALQLLAGRVRSADRRAALLLASRYAEYAGWLAQEMGDDGRAFWWTERAVELAAAGGDNDMKAYAYVRRGLIALYQHDAAGTVALARAAQAATADARIQGLAAQREAQGHALAGDYDACMRAIDHARAKLAAAQAGAEPVVGPSHVIDVVTMTSGWCLLDLGRPLQAAGILEGELKRMSSQALRAQARYRARVALAYAAAGEPEAACGAVAPVLDVIGQIGSATIRIELRQLARSLNRWHDLVAIRETRLRLTDSLSSGAFPR